MTGFAGYRWPSGWSLQGSLGAVLDGELGPTTGSASDEIGPGVVGAVSVTRRWTPGGGPWFVSGSLSASGARSSTRPIAGGDEHSLWALDLRAGVIAGRSLGERVHPYLVARGFGGPVRATLAGDRVTGNDAHHYQVGAGLAVTVRGGLGVTVDLSALGEQSVSLGLSWQR